MTAQADQQRRASRRTADDTRRATMRAKREQKAKETGRK